MYRTRRALVKIARAHFYSRFQRRPASAKISADDIHSSINLGSALILIRVFAFSIVRLRRMSGGLHRKSVILRRRRGTCIAAMGMTPVSFAWD